MSKNQKLGDRGKYDFTSATGVVITLRSLSEADAEKFLNNRSQWILNGLVKAMQNDDQERFTKVANDVVQIVQVLVPDEKARKAAKREMREWLNSYQRRGEFIDIFTRILYAEMALAKGVPIPEQGDEDSLLEEEDDEQEIDPETASAEKLEQLGEDLAAED